jgi:predicted O-methyltransferase YrrM
MSHVIEWAGAQGYVEDLVPERADELVRMEEYAREHRFPIIGPACGFFCYQMARTLGARRIFELGSGFGYSTAWFARAVRENGGGEVFHVVWDEDLSARARTHLEALEVGDLVRYRVGEAIETLRATEGPFDIIFNDIDKEGYPAALPVIEEKLRPGGLLIVDNLLWHGRVFDDVDQSDSTRGVRELTRRVFGSNRWLPSIVPLRDGLLLATRV